MSDDPIKPRFALRINGSRVGDAARPRADGAATGYGLPNRRPMLRINSSRLTAVKPPGDDEAAS